MKVFSHPAITDVKDMRTLYPIAFSVDSKSYLVLSMTEQRSGTKTSRSQT